MSGSRTASGLTSEKPLRTTTYTCPSTARELTSVATKELVEGQGHNWTAILEGELRKAQLAQDEYPGLKLREVEQAVFATFIHSQPMGSKALLPELSQVELPFEYFPVVAVEGSAVPIVLAPDGRPIAAAGTAGPGRAVAFGTWQPVCGSGGDGSLGGGRRGARSRYQALEFCRVHGQVLHLAARPLREPPRRHVDAAKRHSRRGPGIGRAVAALFAREGADIAILYLCEHDDAAKTQDIVEKEGRRAITVAGDIGDKQFCERAVEQTLDQLGRLDILVNNAGEQHSDKDIRDITEEQLREAFEIIDRGLAITDEVFEG